MRAGITRTSREKPNSLQWPNRTNQSQLYSCGTMPDVQKRNLERKDLNYHERPRYLAPKQSDRLAAY